ncbi:2-hydroxyacid dehydrogenase [Sulfurisphaera ohwakuensis]|nr:D-3-phosphoglycerate dehydrogenase [Sulfurisphaera ohwakuensis]
MIISTVKLPEECKRLIPVKDEGITEDDIRNAEIIMLWPSQAREILPKAEKVKIIQTFSAGVDDFPFELLKKDQLLYSNAGAYSISVAEHAFALILALAKGVGVKKRVETYPLNNSTILILGAGGIGSEVAKIAKLGFNMYVIGVSRSFKGTYYDEKYSLKDLEKVIGRADVIVDTLPLNKETRGILNYSVLSKVKEKCIIVNVGRAETVVEDDIYRILKEKPGVRFGTDVFWRVNGKENFSTSKLWELENFTGTPHIAGATANERVLKNALIQACKNVYRILNEGEGENKVKIEDYI